MDTASANKIGLKLLRDEKGMLAYSWRLLPEIVWRQRNWWDGAMQFYYNPETPNMYGLANGVWAATENELSLGPRIWSLPYGVPNGGIENNSTSGFTATGLTAAVTTTASAVAGGLYALSLTSCDTNDTLETSALPNPTRYASRSIRAVCWARIPSGSASVTLHIDEKVGAGAYASTANSGSVALSTTYQQLRTGAVTVGATTDNIRLRLVIDSGTSATVQVDEFSIEDTPTASNMIFPPFHTMTISGTETLVHVTSNAVWTWNELSAGSEGTTGYWVLQFWAAQAITGARVWDNRLFIGYGDAAAFNYSTAGDPATYATSVQTGTTSRALRFAKGRTVADNTWALFKANDTDELWSQTAPATGVWGGAAATTPFEVGFADRNITGLYEHMGNVLVGKDDGLYVLATQDFPTNFLGMTNVAEGIQFSVGMSHFDRGCFYAGNFYTLMNDGRLWRWNGSQWQDLSAIIDTPAFTQLGGRVTSLGSDGQWLFLTIEDRNAASTTKETWLFIARESVQGWEIHSIAKVRMTNAYGWGALVNTTSRFIYVAGDHSNAYASYRIQIGTRSNTPRLASLNGLMLSGTITTSYFELPQKMEMNRLELLSEDVSADLTVTAAYTTDGMTSFININATNSTFVTATKEVIAFDNSITGKRIRLQFTLATTSLTTTPVIKGFNLFFERLREWEFIAEIADNQSALQGVPNVLPAEQMLNRLNTLRNSVEGAPLQFDDLDGVARRCIISDMEEVNFTHRTGSGGVPTFIRGVRITLREAIL